MSNFLNISFSCDNYYLMAKLLTDSYRMRQILTEPSPYLNEIDEQKRQSLLEQFQDFMNIASDIPSIQSLLNFGENFDRLPDEEKGKYNAYMDQRLEEMTEAENDEEFIQKEGKEVLEGFKTLKETPFYQSVLDMSLAHQKVLQEDIENNKEEIEESIQPILKGVTAKSMKVFVLPPEMFDVQMALNSEGENVSSVASYPEYFNKEIPKASTIAMVHELMHTYIPLHHDDKFPNETQELVYDVINHSLVELSTNCELGVKVSGLDSYFKMPMHNEILKANFENQQGIKKEEFIKNGVSFPGEFEFESNTEYASIVEGRTTTPKDGLSNDKIRGIVYPYFLAFKNREKENPIETVMNELSRDQKTIIEIYGEDFYNSITEPGYLQSIMETTKKAGNIVELNDVIAEDAFGIEKEQTIFKVNDINKECFTGKGAVRGDRIEFTKAQITKDEQQTKEQKEGEVEEVGNE